MVQRKKKLNVKFEIRRGSFISYYNAKAGNGNNDYFRNVINIKDHVFTTNPLYTHKRQHVFHNDKELFENCVLDEKKLKISVLSLQLIQMLII